MELIKTTNIDFMGKRKWFYIFSLAIIIVGLTVFGIRGKANFGVDFVGGDLLQIKFASPTSVVNLRNQLKNANIDEVTVQEVGTEQNEFIIKSPPDTSDKILNMLQITYGKENIEVEAKSVISPSMSATLRKKSLAAFLVGIIGILIYLTIRFEFHFAACATISIFHDLLIIIAILALSKKVIDSTIIAALLTIAGYSVNDTVVVFDRVRENIRKTRSKNYMEIFNQSINETISRTILTGLSVIIVDILLFLFGGEPLKNFAYTLFFGFVFGTYSSIFVASAILVDWQKMSAFRLKL